METKRIIVEHDPYEEWSPKKSKNLWKYLAVKNLVNFIDDEDGIYQENRINNILQYMIMPRWNKFAERYDELINLLGNKELEYNDSDERIWSTKGALYYINHDNITIMTPINNLNDGKIIDYSHGDYNPFTNDIATFSEKPAFVFKKGLVSINISNFLKLYAFLEGMKNTYHILRNDPLENHPDYKTYGEFINSFEEIDEDEPDDDINYDLLRYLNKKQHTNP